MRPAHSLAAVNSGFMTNPAMRAFCRFAVWPKVKEFVCGLPAGAILADVGCGNGKYFGIRSDVAVLGSDRSAGVREVCSRSQPPASYS